MGYEFQGQIHPLISDYLRPNVRYYVRATADPKLFLVDLRNLFTPWH